MNHHEKTAEVHVPGLVDLHAQSRLSLNFLQGAVDYWQNAVPYFNIKYNPPGARFQHNHWDHSENLGRMLYGAVLARIVCGETSELPVEKCWKQLIYQSIPDGQGLSFKPNPSPYDTLAGARDQAAEQGEVASKPMLHADLWDNRSVFTGLLLSYEQTGDKKAFEAAHRMVQQLKELAYWEDDCAYFRIMGIPLGWDPAHATAPPIMGQHMGGWISPLLHFFKMTGDKSALHLAQGLGSAFLRVYPETPLATVNPIEPILGMNSHSVYFMLAGLVRLTRTTGERRFLDWAKRQFDGMLLHLCSETGWTQEFMPWQTCEGIPSCETCSLADRIDTDIQLALAGYPEYWNDAQRCAFNYLKEAQLTDTSWMPLTATTQEDFWISTYRIRERSLGAYVGWGAPHDLVDTNSRAPGRIQNCCGPHGAFAVYQLWHYTVQKNSDGVFVNLALSRDTPWCSVLTHAPVHGKMEISMKINAPLHVRLPDWVDPSKVSVTVDGKPQTFAMTGAFVKTSGYAGRTVVVEYPMRHEKRSEKIAGKTYTTSWVDDYVMNIEPSGVVAPLYQRDIKTIAKTYDRSPVWPQAIGEMEW